MPRFFVSWAVFFCKGGGGGEEAGSSINSGETVNGLCGSDLSQRSRGVPEGQVVSRQFLCDSVPVFYGKTNAGGFCNVSCRGLSNSKRLCVIIIPF